MVRTSREKVQVIGIDPGQEGAIVAMYQSGRIELHRMPETNHDIYMLLLGMAEAELAMIEQITPAPIGLPGEKKQFCRSPRTTAVFHEHYGALIMALTVIDVKTERVRPQEWQKVLGCLTHGNKAISKARAQERFPELRKQITINNADALLIAEYGRIKLTGRWNRRKTA